MIKRYAAHQVVVSAHDTCKQYVVEMENHIVSRVFPLREELPFTEWTGGMIVLSPCRKEEARLIHFPIETAALLAVLLRETSDRTSLYAWHISAEDISKGTVYSLRQL